MLLPSEDIQVAGWFCLSVCRTFSEAQAGQLFLSLALQLKEVFAQDLIQPRIRKVRPTFSLLAVTDWGHRSLCL